MAYCGWFFGGLVGENMLLAIWYGLLALSVVGGPVMWTVAYGSVQLAFSPGNIGRDAMLYYLLETIILVAWGSWGILSAPGKLRRWVFITASMYSLYEACDRLLSGMPERYPLGVLFLAYSLWQFIVWDRPGRHYIY